jgi:uncharacterized protein (DUF697 family)
MLMRDVQSQLTDDFFYFFLRLRKDRIRKVVNILQSKCPGETPEQLARRLIASQRQLSFLGGGLLHLPMLIPGMGNVVQGLGAASGAAVLTRMHLYLILEIALLYGMDIDDQARVGEMVQVVLATGLVAGAPFLLDIFGFNPLLGVPVAALSAATVAQLIGERAIEYYRHAAAVPALPEAAPA